MNDTPSGSPSPAGRSADEARPVVVPELRTPLRDIGDNSARVIVAGAVVILFVAVFFEDVLQSSRFWKDLQDVSDTFAPFVTLLASAVGAAATYFFTERRNK
jgi:hypothetical protein